MNSWNIMSKWVRWCVARGLISLYIPCAAHETLVLYSNVLGHLSPLFKFFVSPLLPSLNILRQSCLWDLHMPDSTQWSARSIPKSTSPTGITQPTPPILDTLYDGSSAASASTSSTGDSKIQYKGSQRITGPNGHLNVPASAGIWNPGSWGDNFPRELTEPDTSRRSIMDLD
ncbi:hypothetical protein DL96DRAFT_506078 [Flagelloscypha sp. PMI_526]|nr:hypothetical protein DL96DRAFT_506078 [Flagelloscypha sp. PMI_526]